MWNIILVEYKLNLLYVYNRELTKIFWKTEKQKYVKAGATGRN